MKILLRHFNAKVGRDNIFKPTIGNDSLHQGSKDNGVRTVTLAKSKNLVVKNMMFPPHQNIQKHSWTSPDGKTHNQVDHILREDGIRVYLMYDLSRELTVILITTWWLQTLGKDWQ